MNRFPKTATVALSAAALGLVVAACQPQGGPPPADVMAADEMRELLVGNTVIGEHRSWKLTFASYFDPDGTAKAVLRIQGEGDREITGTHYANDQDEFCSEYPKLEGDQQVFCAKLFPLGDGRYQELHADGTRGSIYNQILEGEQLDTFR